MTESVTVARQLEAEWQIPVTVSILRERTPDNHADGLSTVTDVQAGTGTSVIWEPVEFPLLLCPRCKAKFDSMRSKLGPWKTIEAPPAWHVAVYLATFFIVLPAVMFYLWALSQDNVLLIQRPSERRGFLIIVWMTAYLVCGAGAAGLWYFRPRTLREDRPVARWFAGVYSFRELIDTDADIDVGFGRPEPIESRSGA